MALSTSALSQNFAPIQTLTFSATATTSTQAFTYTDISVVTSIDSASAITSCLVQNAGTKVGFLKFGKTAAVTDTPILPGAIYVLDKGILKDVAIICGGTDTTTIYVTAGIGS